jgi:hypothetical protein
VALLSQLGLAATFQMCSWNGFTQAQGTQSSTHTYVTAHTI